jgi:hypothetical protein
MPEASIVRVTTSPAGVPNRQMNSAIGKFAVEPNREYNTRFYGESFLKNFISKENRD